MVLIINLLRFFECNNEKIGSHNSRFLCHCEQFFKWLVKVKLVGNDTLAVAH